MRQTDSRLLRRDLADEGRSAQLLLWSLVPAISCLLLSHWLS